ncbi:MAG: tetratricopeptide repeat protein [Candidatus Aegiribacteria sp.]|nr:tetratricopeptide repeat protein [Candidatus Aegiribacteria sp.]
MQYLLFSILAASNLTGWRDGYSSGNWEYAYNQAEIAIADDSTGSDAWAALAFSANVLGYHDEATEFARKAVELDSLSAMAWGALGRSCSDSTEESLSFFQTALEYDSTLILGLVGKAHCLMVQENYSDALEILTSAMRIDSSWISIWLKTSEIYRYQHEFEKALVCVNTALGQWPVNKQLLFEAGWIMELTGKYQAAEMIYRKIADTYPDDTGSLIDLGLLLESQARYGEAVKAYRELGRRNPENYWCLGEIAVCLENAGNTDAARRSYLDGIEVNPDYSFAQYRLGLMAEDNGDIEEAIRWYSECTESDRSFIDAWIAIGLLYEDMGNYTAAETVYRRVLEIDPAYSWTWGELGLVLEQLGEFEEAGEAYENGVAVDSEYLWAWEQRGILFENNGDLEAAAAWYRRAVTETVCPGTWLLGELGFVLEQLGSTDSAAVYYSEAISVDSAYIFGYQRLAPLLAQSGNTEEALALWCSYIEAGGFESTSLCERVLIYERTGRDDEADSLAVLIADDYPYAWIDLAWTYSKVNPEISFQLAVKAEEESVGDDPEFWLLMAGLYAELGEKDEVERSYEVASVIAPDSIDVWLEWGYFLFDEGKDEEAAEMYRQAIELDSLSFSAWSSLGEALLFSDQYDDAMTALERSLELNPGFSWVYAYMGLVHEQKGDSDSAMDYYFQALSVSPGYDYAETRIRGITDRGFDPEWNRREARRFNVTLYVDTRVDNGNVRERKYSTGLEISFEYDTRGSDVSLEMDYRFIETSKDYESDYTWTKITMSLERVLSKHFTVSASSSWDRQPGTVRPCQISSYLSFAYTEWLNDWLWLSPSLGIGQVNTHWASGLENDRTDRITLYGSMSLWINDDESPLPSLWLWGNFYIPPDDPDNTLLNGLAELTFEMWDPLSLTMGYSVGYERTPVYEYWEKYDTEFYSRLNLRLF